MFTNMQVQPLFKLFSMKNSVKSTFSFKIALFSRNIFGFCSKTFGFLSITQTAVWKNYVRIYSHQKTFRHINSLLVFLPKMCVNVITTALYLTYMLPKCYVKSIYSLTLLSLRKIVLLDHIFYQLKW